MSYLVLVRHGESRWNLAGKFTGWVDVPLSKRGIKEAIASAKKLSGIKFDLAYTSKLERAQETLLLILAFQNKTGIFLHNQTKIKNKWTVNSNRFDKDDIPIYSKTALNERYYGDLQGMKKDSARNKFGEAQVFEWRRSFTTRPPNGESLKDVYNRAIPYFEREILVKLKKRKNIIVSIHGNTMRALIKHIEDISDTEIAFLELPFGKPFVYELKQGKLKMVSNNFLFNRPINW